MSFSAISEWIVLDNAGSVSASLSRGKLSWNMAAIGRCLDGTSAIDVEF